MSLGGGAGGKTIDGSKPVCLRLVQLQIIPLACIPTLPSFSFIPYPQSTGASRCVRMHIHEGGRSLILTLEPILGLKDSGLNLGYREDRWRPGAHGRRTLALIPTLALSLALPSSQQVGGLKLPSSVHDTVTHLLAYRHKDPKRPLATAAALKARLHLWPRAGQPHMCRTATLLHYYPTTAMPCDVMRCSQLRRWSEHRITSHVPN